MVSLFVNPNKVEQKEQVLFVPSDSYIGDAFTENLEEYEVLKDFFDPDIQKEAKGIITSWVEGKTLNQDSVVLEIGCGTGYFSNAFLDLNFDFNKLVVNDLSFEMLKKCRANLESRKHSLDNIDFFCGDIGSSHFKENTFDFIFGSSIVHHILDVELFFKELYRVMKPGAYFAVSEPMAKSYLMVSSVMQMINLLSVAQDCPFTKEEERTFKSFIVIM